MLYRGDRLVGVEMFEPEDLDRARARFEELRGRTVDAHAAFGAQAGGGDPVSHRG
jgi:hypothetical protein